MSFQGALILVVAAVVVSGCSSQSETPATPAQVSASLASEVAAMMSSTPQCPQADWRCFPAEAVAAGGPVLGPPKAAGMRVTDTHVALRALQGETLRGVDVQLSHPGRAGYIWLGELPGRADLTPTRAWMRATRVRGTTALFSSDVYGVQLSWNEQGRKMRLFVSKTFGGAAPTESELLAMADALVVYDGA